MHIATYNMDSMTAAGYAYACTWGTIINVTNPNLLSPLVYAKVNHQFTKQLVVWSCQDEQLQEENILK